MLQDWHSVERVKRQVGPGAHFRLEVPESVGHLFVRQGQAGDLDINAAWKAK